MVLDRLMSASLGQPCAIQEEEYIFTVETSFFSKVKLRAKV
jgi:hypothetical protein